LYYRPFQFDNISYSNWDWTNDPLHRHSTIDYCTFVGGNFVTRLNQSQNVVAHSNAKTKYKVMAYTSCETMCSISSLWNENILQQFDGKGLWQSSCQVHYQ